IQERLNVGADTRPVVLDLRDGGEVVSAQEVRRGGSPPAGEPDRLSGRQVRQGAVDRVEAGAESLACLLRGELRDELKQAVIDPEVVAEQLAQGFGVHT